MTNLINPYLRITHPILQNSLKYLSMKVRSIHEYNKSQFDWILDHNINMPLKLITRQGLGLVCMMLWPRPYWVWELKRQILYARWMPSTIRVSWVHPPMDDLLLTRNQHLHMYYTNLSSWCPGSRPVAYEGHAHIGNSTCRHQQLVVLELWNIGCVNIPIVLKFQNGQ